VPIILSIGPLTCGIASVAATAGLIVWGVVRNRHARLQAKAMNSGHKGLSTS
jgi:hypothetical protein